MPIQKEISESILFVFELVTMMKSGSITVSVPKAVYPFQVSSF